MRFLVSGLLAATILGSAAIVYAQQDEFFDTLLISDEYSKLDKQQNDSLAASRNARNILNQKRKQFNLEQDRKLKKLLEQQKQQEPKNNAKTKQNMERITQLPQAPFGLLWGATYEETLSSGVVLTRTEEKDYPNSFIATQLTKPLKEIRYVVVTFGEENSLWRIISYSNFIKDKPDASLILKEYHRFYDLLKSKYGHAEETYIPATKQITKTIDLGEGKTKQETETVNEEIGNPNFLEQLENGDADLYATFYNSEVGAALSVNVDGQGNSYLILEYKNLKIFKKQQDTTLDAL